MQTKPSLIVGIPAYNEESNIGSLLQELLLQQVHLAWLKKIIVVSDGSNDRTVNEAKAVGYEDLVYVVNDLNRKGLGPRLNQILRYADSDILVILNADITIDDVRFLDKMITPIVTGKADIVSVNLLPLQAQTFIERILEAAYYFKNDLFQIWKTGMNVYTCHGTARAFSRQYYENLIFPESIAEDAYSYFFALDRGFQYRYVADTVARFRLPQILRDHYRQSHRFVDAKRILENTFSKVWIEQLYQYPKTLVLRTFFRQPMGRWMYIFLYGMLSILVCLRILFRVTTTAEQWEIAQSTKNIHAH